MSSIVGLFWKICLMRLGPDRVPVDPLFFRLVMAVFFFCSFLYGLLLLPQVSAFQVAMIIFLNTSILALAIYLFLYFFKTSYRFKGTFLAIIGTDVIITAMALPCAVIQLYIGIESLQGLLEFIKVIFVAWHLMIIGFVFSRSFDIEFALGFILSVTLYILTKAIDLAVFPELVSGAG